ncbi:MAG: D-aminoacylase, partial [bacterium]|nr:D-aminoacylase [bacterium]
MKSNKLTRREFTKIGSLATLGVLTGCSLRNPFQLIIKNGALIDGTGSPALRLDIGIKNGKIKAIGNLQEIVADRVIDASNLVVAPGFIDIHTHTDIELLVEPRAESKIRQGVTTEIGGNCGGSPFPIAKAERNEYNQRLRERYGIEVTWNDLAGFFDALEARKIGINFATFVGHGDLRAVAVGRNDVAATAEQMEKMKWLLTEAIQQGSLGMSTGLEYAPSSYASTEELIELCKVVSKLNGVYATHIRNEDDFVEQAIEEAMQICREAEVSTQISHLKACNQNNWHKVDNILENLEKAVSAGMNILADRYPYIAYGTGLSVFFPLWSRQGSTDDFLARLNDRSLFAELKNHAENRAKRIGGWDRVVIGYCATDENKRWEGKSILEAAEIDGKKPFEFARNLLIQERNRVNIVGFAMDENNLKKVLTSPSVMVGSDGSAVSPTGKLGEGKPHPRFYGTFPRVLGKYCREDKIFDLETAIKKMTSMPAQKLGLNNRGIIREGFFA